MEESEKEVSTAIFQIHETVKNDINNINNRVLELNKQLENITQKINKLTNNKDSHPTGDHQNSILNSTKLVHEPKTTPNYPVPDNYEPLKQKMPEGVNAEIVGWVDFHRRFKVDVPSRTMSSTADNALYEAARQGQLNWAYDPTHKRFWRLRGG
jgi:hypothetical protein